MQELRTRLNKGRTNAYIYYSYVGGFRRHAYDTNGDGTLDAMEFHNMVTALKRKQAGCESRITNGRSGGTNTTVHELECETNDANRSMTSSPATRQISDLVVEDAEDVEEVPDSLHGKLEEELVTATQDAMDEDGGNEVRHAFAPTNVAPTSRGGMP